MKNSPLVTATVCVRDGAMWVDDCIKALLAQTYRPLEIIAIDDGSSDGSKEKLLSWNQEEGEVPVRVFTQGKKGLSAGRQWAVEEAKGDWVAITDIDVRPEPDWIETMIAETEPLDEEETVVAVTGRTVFGQADDVVSRVRSVEIARKYRARPRKTSLANGPCSMFHRQSLMDIGGFNPDWYHAEDMEVSLRLIGNGGSIIYAPSAVVAHVPESERERFLAKRRRDARAHVRIVRHFPRRKRIGPGLDFIGSSTLVLMVLPLWISALISGLPFVYKAASTNALSWETVQQWWQTKMLLGTLFLMCIHEFILWRGPLGEVNRGALREGKVSIGAVLRVRSLTFSWSIALWQGLVLGGVDAIRGQNGHRPLFKK